MKLAKISGFLTKWLPFITILVIALGVLVGNYDPHLGKVLKPYVPIPLFFMLFPMMISLRIEEMGKVLLNPKVILSAVFLNFVITPILGKFFAMIFFRNTPPLLAVGFILNMVTPCSGMAAAWTGFAKGKVETTLVIVALSLLLAIGFIPFWMWVFTRTMVNVPVHIIFRSLIYIVVIPLIAGLLTRRFLVGKMGIEEFRKLKPHLPAISSLGMYVILFMAMLIEAKVTIAHPGYVGILFVSMTAYYFSVFLLTILYAKLIRVSYEDTAALAYGVTAKNLSITIALAITTWGGLSILAPAFDPPIQVLAMMAILYALLRVKGWLVTEELKKPKAYTK